MGKRSGDGVWRRDGGGCGRSESGVASTSNTESTAMRIVNVWMALTLPKMQEEGPQSGSHQAADSLQAVTVKDWEGRDPRHCRR